MHPKPDEVLFFLRQRSANDNEVETLPATVLRSWFYESKPREGYCEQSQWVRFHGLPAETRLPRRQLNKQLYAATMWFLTAYLTSSALLLTPSTSIIRYL